MARNDNRALYILEQDKSNLENQIKTHDAAAQLAENERNKQLYYKAEAEKMLAEVQDIIALAKAPKKKAKKDDQ